MPCVSPATFDCLINRLLLTFLQSRLHTESEVQRLETLKAENLNEETALEQQKQETGKAGENCDPDKNLEGKSSAVEPCEEKKKSVLHDSQERD